MKVIRKIKEMQAYSKALRKEGKIIGLVPTMGYLHEGHLSLIDKAREKSDIVIVTIFVNPTQFAPGEDLDSYPRDFGRDKELCEKHKANVIFSPEPEEMYPYSASTWVVEEELSQGLCGSSRPTHFRGVTTVVTKLFNATLPDLAVFGQKDAQQVMVIKRMVRDLNIPIDIIIAPIVREEDGLAMSSRNKYLSEDERRRALSISRALKAAKKSIEEDGLSNPHELTTRIENMITEAGGKIDYIEIRNSDNLAQVSDLATPVLIAVAVYFGSTRLIDNITIDTSS